MRLNDSYGNLIGQIMLIKPFTSLSKVCSLILQEKKRRNIGHGVNMVYPVEAAVALYSNNGNKVIIKVIMVVKEWGIARKRGLFVPIVVSLVI